MTTLWIVTGILFLMLSGILIQLAYKHMGLKYAKVMVLCILIVVLVGVNTAPAKDLIACII